MILLKLTPITACCLLLSACGTVREVRDEISAKVPETRKALEAPIAFGEPSRVVERKGMRLSASEVAYSKNTGTWLKSKTVSLNASNPMSLTQVIAKFAANGINISSDLPLDNITYVGSINSTDADSALKQVLGSSGLDYEVDDARKMVTIKPLPIRTWTLALGNRRSSFSSNGAGGAGGNASSGQASSSSGSQSGTGGQQSGGASQPSAGGGQSGQGSSPQNTSPNVGSSTSLAGNGADGGSGLGFETSEDYWGTLDRELARRLTVMVPVPRAQAQRAQTSAGLPPLPALPMVAAGLPMSLNQPAPLMMGGSAGPQDQNGASGVAELYVPKKIGTYSLNPVTGAITVQAPHWLLADLDVYFRRTADMYNTSMSFEGVLILVSNSRSDSEGLDIQQFANFAAGRYGAVLSNNTLGGVTLSFGSGKIPNVTAGAQQVGGALMGITSPKDGLQIFNAYLQERGDSSIIQRPRLSTTSGVPGEYSNIKKDFYTIVTQAASAGNTGSAQQATSNQLVPLDFGTELRILPRYDIATGLVRASIKMRSVVQDGQKNFLQIISTPTGAQQVNQPIPIPRELKYGGEDLFRDGDLIVVGGQSEETLQSSENGLPTADGPLGGIFGTKKGTKAGGTYYFALKVSVNKR